MLQVACLGEVLMTALWVRAGVRMCMGTRTRQNSALTTWQMSEF